MAFLHSTPDDLRLWMHQKGQHFAAWYRCIAIDAALTRAFEGISWKSVRSVRLEPHEPLLAAWGWSVCFLIACPDPAGREAVAESAAAGVSRSSSARRSCGAAKAARGLGRQRTAAATKAGTSRLSVGVPSRGAESRPRRRRRRAVTWALTDLVRGSLAASARAERAEAAVVARQVGRAARPPLRLDPSAAVARGARTSSRPAACTCPSASCGTRDRASARSPWPLPSAG